MLKIARASVYAQIVLAMCGTLSFVYGTIHSTAMALSLYAVVALEIKAPRLLKIYAVLLLALTVTEANTTVGATGRQLPPTNATTYHWELPGVEHTFIGGWERYGAVAGAVAVDATTADLHGDFGNEEAPALAAYVARAFDRPVVRAPRVAGGRAATLAL